MATVDAEKIVRGYLAGATGANVVGRTPKETTDAGWVRLTQLDASAAGGHRSEHLIGYWLQLDCYSSEAGADGSQQREAFLLKQAIRSALVDLPNQNDAIDAVCSGVEITGDARNPDVSFEPTRERFILTAIVWMHE